jgi:hypothetical protein
VAAPSLTPELAVQRLPSLSRDIHAGVLIDADGEVLAHGLGRPAAGVFAGGARELLDRAGELDGPVSEVEAWVGGAAVFVLRVGGRIVAVATGRLAISSVVRYDLRRLMLGLPAPS